MIRSVCTPLKATASSIPVTSDTKGSFQSEGMSCSTRHHVHNKQADPKIMNYSLRLISLPSFFFNLFKPSLLPFAR
jgi:hypothetical protein